MHKILSVIAQICIFVSCMAGFSKPAFALGWILEPYAGYEIGDRETGNTSYDASGLNLGFRAGATSQTLLFGLEYALGDLSIEQTGSDDEVSTTDLGVFFGIELTMLRAWVTYWLESEGKSDKNNGTYAGEGGYKMGIGFKAFGQASINIEKTLRTWDEFEGQNISGPEVEIDAFMVSVSLPFTF